MEAFVFFIIVNFSLKETKLIFNEILEGNIICCFFSIKICLTFTWKDAFDKGSLFGGSVKLGM